MFVFFPFFLFFFPFFFWFAFGCLLFIFFSFCRVGNLADGLGGRGYGGKDSVKLESTVWGGW